MKRVFSQAIFFLAGAVCAFSETYEFKNPLNPVAVVEKTGKGFCVKVSLKASKAFNSNLDKDIDFSNAKNFARSALLKLHNAQQADIKGFSCKKIEYIDGGRVRAEFCAFQVIPKKFNPPPKPIAPKPQPQKPAQTGAATQAADKAQAPQQPQAAQPAQTQTPAQPQNAAPASQKAEAAQEGQGAKPAQAPNTPAATQPQPPAQAVKPAQSPAQTPQPTKTAPAAQPAQNAQAARPAPQPAQETPKTSASAESAAVKLLTPNN